MSHRFKLYLVATFTISWLAWGTLIALTDVRWTAYGRPLFMALYVLGGLGPTIAAYIAMLATREQSPLSEFHARLFSWRWRWSAIALGLPVILVLASAGIASIADPAYVATLHLRPWYAFVPAFFVMILGGGLEELGWRGVAQPEAEYRAAPLLAGLFVGLIWAAWHLPLFYLPGVGQYGTNFPIFAVGVIGNALLLAWLYGRTKSILACIIFHASFNAVLALGFSASPRSGLPMLLDALLSIVLGGTLVLLWQRKQSVTATRRSVRD
jgi:membrane protease YdiL (CAAX protease family)